MRTEQYIVQVDLDELKFNQFFVEIETILFAQTFKNDIIAGVSAVNDKRHADELILNHRTTVDQLCRLAPARLRSRDDFNAGQGVSRWPVVVVVVQMLHVDLWSWLGNRIRDTELHLPRLNGRLVRGVHDVQHQLVGGLVVPHWTDVHGHL
ncbi:hypothetical protein D3C75_194790 [compost metagenome]